MKIWYQANETPAMQPFKSHDRLCQTSSNWVLCAEAIPACQGDIIPLYDVQH